MGRMAAKANSGGHREVDLYRRNFHKQHHVFNVGAMGVAMAENESRESFRKQSEIVSVRSALLAGRVWLPFMLLKGV